MTIQEEISNCVLKHFEKAYINTNNERGRILEIRQSSKIKNLELYFTISNYKDAKFLA